MNSQKQTTKKIMIVDDDELILGILNIVLSDSGYEVIQVNDPTKVLPSMIKTPPDLVFLDIIMPGKDGVEVLKEIKQNKKLKKIPVVFVSSSEKVKTYANEFGASAYLEKPFEIEHIHAMVEKFLS